MSCACSETKYSSDTFLFLQVCDARLHLSLGIGLHLSNLLYDDCQSLDLLCALALDGQLNEQRQSLVDLLLAKQHCENDAAQLTAQAQQLQEVHDLLFSTATAESAGALDNKMAQHWAVTKT